MALKSNEFAKSGTSKYLNEINSNIADQILYEDNHIIALNKLPRQLVQGDSSGDPSLLDLVKQYIKVKYKKPGDVFLGTVHRLDRPVSGVVIFARTSKALERLNKLFASREVKKTYLAIVDGYPKKEKDTLVHYLSKDADKNRTHAYDKEKKGGKKSSLTYKVVKHIARKTLLEINPETGRSHQIRAQLSKIGLPIIGDLKYGAEHRNIDRSICLHSYKLQFIHPTKKEPVLIQAKIPKNSIWIPYR